MPIKYSKYKRPINHNTISGKEEKKFTGFKISDTLFIGIITLMGYGLLYTFNADCVIRSMSASDSERCRPPNPKHVGHRFRTMSATF